MFSMWLRNAAQTTAGQKLAETKLPSLEKSPCTGASLPLHKGAEAEVSRAGISLAHLKAGAREGFKLAVVPHP